LVKAVHDAGGRLAIAGGKLKVSAPEPLPDALVGELRAHKAEVLTYLNKRADILCPAALTGAPATDDGTDWRHDYEERAAIAEHDGGLDRAEAECRAFEAAVVHWMNCNPPTDPGPDHCAGCGGPLGHIGRDSVPVIRGNGEHVWVHHRCHHRLMARRYAEAVEALAAMGLTPPTGWRARR
jgi:hypothetical protein